MMDQFPWSFFPHSARGQRHSRDFKKKPRYSEAEFQDMLRRLSRPTMSSQAKTILPKLVYPHCIGSYRWNQMAGFRDVQKCIYNRYGGRRTGRMI